MTTVLGLIVISDGQTQTRRYFCISPVTMFARHKTGFVNRLHSLCWNK